MRSIHTFAIQTPTVATTRQFVEQSSPQAQSKPQVVFSPRSQRWRLRTLAIFFLICFCAVLARLFYIQVLRSGEYKERARRQYEAKVELRPSRGIVIDRNGKVLATTVQSVSYAVDPKMIENKSKITRELSDVSGIPQPMLLKKISDNADKNYTWLARGLSIHELGKMDSLTDPGLIRLTEPRRNYVFGSMAAQLIGSTNVDNRGLSGIELVYDSLLHGESGFQLMQRDGKSRLRPAVNDVIKPVLNGKTVQLTIDAELQLIVEYELNKGIEESKAVSGTVIAMNPQTGEILALACYPTFNPNLVRSANPDAMRLRAITDMYEPGSTFKLITTAAALEEKLITPSSIVDGKGGTMTIHSTRDDKDIVIRDHEPIGMITLTKALEQSSNIVFAELAQKLPSSTFYKYTRDFGFGIPTGINFPGEVRGRLKKPNEYDQSTKLFMGFGYQLSATALQMLTAYSTVANGGVMMKPYIVKSVLDNSGQPIEEYAPQKIRRVISDTTARILAQMFASVVERGTGVLAQLDGIKVAGKTGTAQQLVNGEYSKQAYTASFAGFFPADNPQIVMIVMLDRPQTDIYGGKTAAPIFGAIARRMITSPSLSASFPALAVKAPTEKFSDTVIVPDVRGISYTKAQELLHQQGLRSNGTLSDGMVSSQIPKQGSKIIRGSEVKLTLQAKPSEPQNTEQVPLKRTSRNSKQATSALPKKQGKVADVRGMSIRRAMALLHSQNIPVKIKGSGKVVKQYVTTVRGKVVCTLECK